ncbi:hypothetical protein [Nocardiopsis sp. NRRL B-16309]|uniref:hypothetical protein n=1 Tax=Nocardiopsis sp. NRRL B-16309 TaxID=1519494 RepID=UPI000B0BC4C0|nr:hypothetical protein [Nocardiopsis sp. NRRL B-16309]
MGQHPGGGDRNTRPRRRGHRLGPGARHLGADYLVHLDIRALTSEDTPHQGTAPHSLTSARAFTDDLVADAVKPRVCFPGLPAHSPSTRTRDPPHHRSSSWDRSWAVLGLTSEPLMALGTAQGRRATRAWLRRRRHPPEPGRRHALTGRG